MATKYIKTKDKKNIIFSGLNFHSDFKYLNPVSAGFINIGINEERKIKCVCYGKRFSLGLESLSEDTHLAQIQIIESRY